MKIVILLLFFSVLALISHISLNIKETNYTVLGDKEIFTNNLKSVNFIDLIYEKLNNENKIGFYSKDFIKKDIRTIDVINDIEDNIKINDISVQNILKKTDLLVLAAGNNEIQYKLSKIDETTNDIEIYRYLDSVINDIDNLIKQIQKISKCNIIFIGFYNDTNNTTNDKYYKYINSKIENNNNITYINLFNILNKNKDYLTESDKVYITNEGNLAIYNKIMRKIDKLDLHTLS